MTELASHLATQAQARGVEVIGFNFFGMKAWSHKYLAKLLINQRCTAVHAHGLRAAFHCCVALNGRHDPPLIYTVHGLHQLHFWAPLRRIVNLAERLVARRSTFVTYVSHADVQLARLWCIAPDPNQIALIPNGVDMAKLSAMENEQRTFDAIFIGRWVRQKDPVLASQILAELAARGWRCAIGGAGSLAPEVLQVLARDEGGHLVEQLGPLSHQEALSALSKARLVIMPSRWEGLPLLPMEAAALGVVNLTSDLAACRELIPSPAHGKLISSRQTSEWVDAAQNLLQCDLSYISRSAKEYIRDNYDINNTLAAYLGVYEAATRHG
ncbi:glycosyltransferase involved in cell wall biosynthesis [Inhella inkyongensis]|uniref:Glycosyltransferase involved in cell wall biosynthesis n=2 Tax=Inhella inkyongensis TaxID=392593 RepID=A0A840RZ05_9BURK|nr:glycosyltransferase involved in cell wall biosynthesis [Inhella inkyongensis]